jgi:hypothetical protein
MKKVIFAAVLTLGTIFASCDSNSKPNEGETPESTEVKTPAETTTVTTPSVDSAKVEEKKSEDKK